METIATLGCFWTNDKSRSMNLLGNFKYFLSDWLNADESDDAYIMVAGDRHVNGFQQHLASSVAQST